MPFYFSVYSTLLLIGFLQGLVYGGLLIRRGLREERLSDLLLAALLILVGLHIAQYMLGFAGWYDSRDGYSSFMFYFPFHHLFIVAPVIYFYVRSLINTEFRLGREHWWHFIPGLIYFGLYVFSFVADIVVSYWIQGNSLPEHFGTQGAWSAWRQGAVDVELTYLSKLSFLIYSVLTIMVYRQYKKHIYNQYSDTERIEFNWLRIILYIIVATLLFDLVWTILGEFVESSYTFGWAKRFAFAIMIYLLSILGYSHTQSLPQQLAFNPEKDKEEGDEFDKNDFPELAAHKSRLVDLMNTEKPYLNSNITLKDLAQQVGVNTSVLSKVINTGYQQNFNEFINAQRVNAVKEKLADKSYEHLTLTAIAFECGFNSKATFNRAFKKFAGLSPREFVAKIKAA